MSTQSRAIILTDAELGDVAGGVRDICTPDDPNGENGDRGEPEMALGRVQKDTVIDSLTRGCVRELKIPSAKLMLEGRSSNRVTNPG
ncbi:MAG: hypothetical protein AAGF56_15200, partial [Pseudomonadota bacterium]